LYVSIPLNYCIQTGKFGVLLEKIITFMTHLSKNVKNGNITNKYFRLTNETENETNLMHNKLEYKFEFIF